MIEDQRVTCGVCHQRIDPPGPVLMTDIPRRKAVVFTHPACAIPVGGDQ